MNAARVRVYVHKRRDRKNLVLRAMWDEAGRGRRREKYYPPAWDGRHEISSGVRVRREAERIAREWEQRLNVRASSGDWPTVVERFFAEHAADQSEAHRSSTRTALKDLHRVLEPETPADVTTDVLSRVRGAMQQRGLAPSTISARMMRIHKILVWAADLGLGPEPGRAPRPKLKGAKRFKTRPITAAEFESILAAAPSVVRPEDVAAWRHGLHVLWLSSLRLGEALNLWWGPHCGGHWLVRLDREGQEAIMISGDAEKGGKDREIIAAPDFVEYLQGVPAERRRGRVVGPLRGRSRRPLGLPMIGRYIEDMGEAAGVVVSRPGAKETRYASAQSFRRGFATRWAPEVHPLTLQETMRHEHASTTAQYYQDVKIKHYAADFRSAWRRLCRMREEPAGVGAVFGAADGEAGPRAAAGGRRK